MDRVATKKKVKRRGIDLDDYDRLMGISSVNLLTRIGLGTGM